MLKKWMVCKQREKRLSTLGMIVVETNYGFPLDANAKLIYNTLYSTIVFIRDYCFTILFDHN